MSNIDIYEKKEDQLAVKKPVSDMFSEADDDPRYND